MNKSINRLDWFFLLPLVVSVTMLAEIDPPRTGALSLAQWEQTAILVPATLFIALAVAIASAIDRRRGEEYLFQVLANSALVAVATISLVHLAWIIGVKAFDLPDISAENMVGTTMLSLILSYYWFRLKGIAQ